MGNHFAGVSDAELVASIKVLVRDERKHLVEVLRRLAEIDSRNIAERYGYPSLFEFCRKEFRYAEGETARRIHAARLAARFPAIFRLLDAGRLSLTAISLMAPVMDRSNYRTLLRRALNRPTREIERIVAEYRPEPVPVERIRFITPERVTVPLKASAPDLFSPRGADEPKQTLPVVAPEAVARVHLSFTAEESLFASLERAKELLRHKFPFARLEDIFAEALQALLDRIDPDRRRPSTRAAAKPGPRPESRNIPKWVKDAVWRRDGGTCSFVGPAGRCGSRAFLEYDHVVPFALGGASDDPVNIRLLCRAHNQVEARRLLG